ncbi:MAG TPA: PRC-barrel domain-containing protein [Methyloceanibacter sp.]|jgi:sporulation protein YlmC with PRC-barrel domain|nr:PRC-barrel domain-containing protein [Methyloceanibacter sp.]
MNRLLTCTALGLVLGLSPALAQQPSDDTQSPPAVQQPTIPEVMPSEPSEPMQPSDPAAPIPGDTSDISPAQPDPAPPQSSEAPKSIEPIAPKSAELSGNTKFLMKQESSDYLASNLIGESVYNSQDETIGSVSDLVTDEIGKVVAVLIGHGGFLGMGQKEVAIRFEDLKLARDEDNDIKVVVNLDNETLAAAPDYEKLSEQNMAIGASEERNDQRGTSQTY